MASELIAHAIAALAGAVPSIGALIAAVRKKEREIEEMRIQLAAEALERQHLSTALSRLDASLSTGLDKRIRDAALRIAARASRSDLSTSKEEIEKAVSPLRADIARIEDERKADAERWTEVHRALGQIEGMLEGVRDRMRGK